ncbi:MAG: FecR domain-containing protein [Nitrospirota bacterium]
MKRASIILVFIAVPLLYLVLPHSASAHTCEKWIAKAVSVQGDVQTLKEGETQWLSVKMQDTFCTGDMIRVMEQGRAAVVLWNGVIMRFDQNTTVTFNGVENENTSLIDILKGVVNFFSRWPRSLNITTPFVNGIVEGTEFLAKVGSDNTVLSVFEGKVLATNKAGSLTLTSGQTAVAAHDQPPVLQTVVRPRDAVQWALYYPPVIYIREEKLREDDPRHMTQRASSLLHVGRVDEAKAEIGRALNADPGNSLAFALQSVIATVQNEKEKALSLAKQAVEADKKSAAAYISLSYARQAHFDLEGSLISLQEAVKAEPENAIAWARLSEIRLSFGEIDKAVKAADKAFELNPHIARTHTVRGFAYLTQVKIRESMELFEKAILLDQADPLPRLGLGLANIRKGCLQEGRRQIEIAVSLDPDNSLIRSYLGKAYYEEKQDRMSEDQYAMAKEFDPRDPTPFFYDAIRKQSINCPVEALHDMQKAIELNDNRAVYRSRMLLDADLAARSASLARIYSDLGFEQLALVEGWKSVNNDSADFSGHRFLADTYSALPRHEIARVSELLQSQLLQPINIIPVQPRLAESDLRILEGAGPSDLSFNEFNPLFNRNGVGVQMSSIIGENKTFGDEIVVSAVHGKLSLSAGQFHYETEGWRENNDQQQNISNIFAQVELSAKTSIQAEFRMKNIKSGDLDVFFDPDRFVPDWRYQEEKNSLRFGLHHNITPGSDLIASLIYLDGDYEFLMTGYEGDIDEKGYLGEIQHLYNTERFSLITGAGYYNEDRKDKESMPEFDYSSSTENKPSHKNLYMYAKINVLTNLTLTVGASADFLKGWNAAQKIEKDQLNPKFGIAWNPLVNTTLRMAVFRTLNRAIITDQTIEPTQVSGFNQFYDDTEGAEAWRYGIGLDQKFSSRLYGGAEFSKRELEVPGVTYGATGTRLIEGEWDEQLGRAYLYWTPHGWVSLSTEYQYERFEMPEDFAARMFTELNTHRVKFGMNVFHPSGISVKLNPIYVNQHGDFMKFNPETFETYFESDKDTFWVFDASVSYRFPKRRGMLTLAAKNLFDEDFKFQDTDPRNPRIWPDRLIYGKITLVF